MQFSNNTILGVKPLLTVAEFHQLLGGAIGINAIRRAVREGRIRSIQVGDRKRVVPATELTEWPNRECQVKA